MTTETDLLSRSDSKCELCSSDNNPGVYEVPPGAGGDADTCVLICETCREQIDTPDKTNAHHWRCLSDSMWTPVAAVQVVAWRMLTRLRAESWAQELLDVLYLDDETLTWAQAIDDGDSTEDMVRHLDCNGALLEAGDTVTLIKDLNVKGAGFTAKRGTAVRGISLVPDNSAQIEGRVNGQQIVILTEFVKKTG